MPKLLGLTVDEWVKQRLGGYVKYLVEERQEAVQALAAEGHSEREIKGVLGVDRNTVRKDLGKPRAGGKATSRNEKTPETEMSSGGKATTNPAPLDVLTSLAATDAVRREADAQTTRERRVANREATAASLRQHLTLPEAKYRVLYADPPWSYSDKADAGSVQSGGAEQHYPSLSIPELRALPVATICEPNAVLFLWTTVPLAPDAFTIIDAWGFTYKSMFVWDKHAHNRGHYNSVRHELLLVGVRGSCCLMCRSSSTPSRRPAAPSTAKSPASFASSSTRSIPTANGSSSSRANRSTGGTPGAMKSKGEEAVMASRRDRSGAPVSSALDRIGDRIRHWRENILAFVADQFGVEPDLWQREALEAFASPDPSKRRISLQACVGPGKSALLAWCGLWFLSTQGARGQHPKGFATSITGENLKANLWAEYAKWMARSPYLSAAFTWTASRISANDHPATWFVEARPWPKTANPDEQGKTFSGLHGEYVLVQADESGRNSADHPSRRGAGRPLRLHVREGHSGRQSCVAPRHVLRGRRAAPPLVACSHDHWGPERSAAIAAD